MSRLGKILPPAPKANLWTVWQAHDGILRSRVDHKAWGGFLAQYVRLAPAASTALPMRAPSGKVPRARMTI